MIAKVEWHPGELYPRVGFVVTNMSRPAERRSLWKAARPAAPVPAPALREASPTNRPNSDGLGRKLDDAILALTKAREMLTLDSSALRIALLKSAIGVADASTRAALKEIDDA